MNSVQCVARFKWRPQPPNAQENEKTKTAVATPIGVAYSSIQDPLAESRKVCFNDTSRPCIPYFLTQRIEQEVTWRWEQCVQAKS